MCDDLLNICRLMIFFDRHTLPVLSLLLAEMETQQPWFWNQLSDSRGESSIFDIRIQVENRTMGVSDMKRVTNVQWICLRAVEWDLSFARRTMMNPTRFGQISFCLFFVNTASARGTLVGRARVRKLARFRS